jgi:uncharacterized repeat protein (TIGR01451 family)
MWVTRFLLISSVTTGLLFAQAPTLVGTTPDTAIVGSSGFSIELYGTNFQAGATVFWNNTPLGTSYFRPSSLSAFIPASLLTSARTVQITVRNAGGAVSNFTLFTVRTTPATPVFTGASTDIEVHLDVPQRRELQVVCSGIQPGVVLSWNGQVFPSEAGFIFLSFLIPTDLMLIPGPVDLTLTNPGGSPSNVLRMVIPATRTLTSISPNTVSPGSAGVVLTANGSGFEPGDFLPVRGAAPNTFLPTEFISSTQLRVTVPASLIPPPGTYAGFVIYTGAPAGAGVPQIDPELFPSALYVTANVLPLTVGPPGCTYSLSAAGATVGTAASSGTVQVITQAGCAWSASSPSSAVSVSPANGTGNGTVSYSLAASNVGKSVTLTIAGQPFTVNQVTSCLFGLTPSSASAPAAGASGSFSVGVTGSSCAWTATPNVTWLQILSGGSGTGNGSVNYAVLPSASNVGRTGTIMVGGQTFTVVQAGNAPCTFSLLQGSQSFAAGGGSGTATVQTAAGCAWTAGSNAAWLSIGSVGGSGNGTVSYSVAANPGTGARSGSLTIAGLTYVVTQAGTGSAVSCVASVPGAPQVALEGRTEAVGDVQVSCTGLSGAVAADIALTMNTNVTNTLTGTSAVDAVLLVNEGNARNGQLSSYGTIRWPGVTLVADSSGTATVRITGVRVDASLLTAAANLQGTAVTGLVSVESQVPVPVSNALQTVASAAPTLGFQQPQIFDAGSLTRVTAVYSEGTASGFRAGTRLRLVLNNLPANAVVFGPVFPNEGSGQAQLYSADANGAGGSPITGNPFNGGTYQQLTVTNGVATATWVVTGANGLQVENRTFVVFLQGSGAANGVGISGSLGPVSSVGVASATAPVPRYRDFAAPEKIVNLRVSTVVTKPAGAAVKSGPATAVGSNVTFTTQVVNDDATQTATNVTVRSSVPAGLTIVSCTSSGGQNCATDSAGLATVTAGSLAPGASVTVTEVVAADAPVVNFDAGVTSDDPNASLSGTQAGTSVLLLNGQPVVVGSVPASGTGSSQTFTFQFSHPFGYQNLGVVNVLINKALDGRNGCYLAYAVPAATLYLVNDGGDAGGPYAGTMLLGGSGTIENSQCSVALVSAQGAGAGLTLQLSVTFKPGFGGNRILYVAARDQGTGNSDWQAIGVWQAPFVAAGSIAIADLAPGRGAGIAGTAQQFKITVADTKGAGDLGIVNVLINNFLDGRKACYLAYAAGSNTLYLVNDAGDGGGPFAGSMVLSGGNGAIQNGQCAVNGSGSTVAFAANQMTLTLNVSFTAGFAGNRVVYVAARDKADGNNTDWQASGTWTVQ